mmetsp:Transcript_27098/g.84653  ORF Transcript_27098/g.84653 Transcript_27098/m.84653 type:complete len:314 (-) Transcript_27098:125-1066(-)
MLPLRNTQPKQEQSARAKTTSSLSSRRAESLGKGSGSKALPPVAPAEAALLGGPGAGPGTSTGASAGSDAAAAPARPPGPGGPEPEPSRCWIAASRLGKVTLLRPSFRSSTGRCESCPVLCAFRSSMMVSRRSQGLHRRGSTSAIWCPRRYVPASPHIQLYSSLCMPRYRIASSMLPKFILERLLTSSRFGRGARGSPWVRTPMISTGLPPPCALRNASKSRIVAALFFHSLQRTRSSSAAWCPNRLLPASPHIQLYSSNPRSDDTAERNLGPDAPLGCSAALARHSCAAEAQTSAAEPRSSATFTAVLADRS